MALYIRRLQALIVIGLSGWAVGCGVCAGIGVSRVIPSDATIGVGESVTLVYESGGACVGDDGPTSAHYSPTATVWHTRDTLVVTIDSASGRVVGRAPGDATIYANAGSATIHVR